MEEEPVGASLPGSDAELLNTIRSGHPGAFAVLRARHEAAARRLAGLLTDDPDALVAAAFSQVLEDITRGGGPSDAFRPYLLAAVESQYRATGHGSGGSPMTEPGPAPAGPAQGTPAAPVVTAFLALPERWQAVLWHADIERDAPAVIAPLLGLAAADVPALADQARDGLAREYRLLRPAAGDSSSAALRRDVAPVYLGTTTAAYLAEPSAAGPGLLARLGDGTPPLAVLVASAAVVLAIAGVAIYLLTLSPSTRPANAAGSPGPAAASSHAPSPGVRPGPDRATRTTSHQGGSAGQDPGPGSGPGPGPGPGPGSGPGPGPGSGSGSGSPPPTDPASPPTSRPPATPPPATSPPSTTPPPRSAQPTSTPRPKPTPTPSRPAPPPARVTAQVSVSGPGRWGNIAVVDFGVANSGPATTRPLNASLALPSGAALLTGWHGPPSVPGSVSLSAVLNPPGGNGWTCAPVSGGASCGHPAMPAAAQSGAQLAIRITRSSACGQHIEITVTGGTTPAGAQSGGTIRCAHHAPGTTRRTKAPGTHRPAPGRRDRGGWPGDPRRHSPWPWPGSPRPGWPPPGWPSPGWPGPGAPGPAHHWPHHHWPHHGWPWPS
jgi:hypothetical protein